MINPYYALAQNFSFISPTIYKSRFYKKLIQLTQENVFERNVEPEMLWLKNFLSQKCIFLDIGAGTGDYIYFLDYILFPENIFGFEPNKKLYKRLKNLFPKMNFEPIALSDKNQSAQLNFPIIDKEEFHEKGTLIPIENNNDIKIFTQKVESLRLDDWIKKKELSRLDFIKIDVVGQEIAVIKGAKETIKHYSPTLMIKIEQENHKNNIWDIITEIETLEYSAHYLHREKFILEPLTLNILNRQNTIFAKDDSRFIKNIIFIKN